VLTTPTNRAAPAAVLKDRFREAFACADEPGVCRAPGRVNLIGEHTDYNGLPVLPVTIHQDIRVAFAPTRDDGRVQMRNLDPSFPDATFLNDSAIPPSPAGHWENYTKAAVTGLNRHFGVREFVGMDLLVGGTIPMSAGLSSSSALVVACALAYLRCLDKRLDHDISRIELAAVLAEAEHYVGTRGGGMDQAIILLGDERAACRIDFFPLRVEHVPLPQDHAIVVSNSLVKAEKTGETLHLYNAGPRLCQLICAMAAHQLCREYGESVELTRLGDLWFGNLCLTHAEVAELFDRTFPAASVTLKEAAGALGLSPTQVRDRWLGDLREPDGGFPLRARARHQLTEHQRVDAARDALLAEDAGSLGTLMNDSHESCACDYQISCPELDMLVKIAREAGAAGARLTGAGFGGCTVNLVPRDILDAFGREVHRCYYRDYLGNRPSPHPQGPMFVVQASPAAGYL